ncbi:hypothetical protein FB645_002857 [Coemansia sp. IMI 203386]|nr:hypothetical protein FB645_002857 [Coemansia sp. IMI 203386]
MKASYIAFMAVALVAAATGSFAAQDKQTYPTAQVTTDTKVYRKYERRGFFRRQDVVASDGEGNGQGNGQGDGQGNASKSHTWSGSRRGGRCKHRRGGRGRKSRTGNGNYVDQPTDAVVDPAV